MIKKLLFVLILMVTAATTAQQPKVERANKNFKNLAYIDAQQLYLKIAENGNPSKEVLAKLADTYYFNNDLQEAYTWYQKLFALDNKDIKPVYYFRYAQSLKSLERYEEADVLMKRFNALSSSESRAPGVSEQADYLEMIDFQSGRFTVQNAVEINSWAADFGPAFFDEQNQMLFATSRDSGSFVKRIHQWDEQAFLQLYTADVNVDGTLQDARIFSPVINTRFHESTPAFTQDGGTIYFTSSNSEGGKLRQNKDGITKLKIFKSTKTGDMWTQPVGVSFNSDKYNTAHPALSPDGRKLFFVSDRPGSVGYDPKADHTDSDIWVVDIALDGTIGEPINVASINTHGRETYPFVSKNNVLYFASSGHQGLGGLDVFASTINRDGSMSEVVNIGKPVNTPYDDYSFIINDDTKLGYFSSNRPGGKGGDDIYRIVQLEDLRNTCETIVSGTVIDANTKDALANSMVSITDENNNQIDQAITGTDGKYSFKLECDKQYFIRVTKEDHTADEELFKTPVRNDRINLSSELTSSVIPVLECDDIAKTLDIEEIYFDYDQSGIRSDAAKELAKIQAFLELYPATKVEIRSHTDSRGDAAYNDMLSEKRAQSTRSWLIEKGIDPDRITAKGYGERQLVNNCSDGVSCSDEEQQLNRRSEFIVSGLDQYSECD